MIQIDETRIPTKAGELGWDPDKKLETVRVPCGCEAHKDDPEFYVIYLRPGEELPDGATMRSLVGDADEMERISKSQTIVADLFTHKGGAEAYFEQSRTRVRTSVTIVGIGGLDSLFDDDPFGNDPGMGILGDLLRRRGGRRWPFGG